MTVSQPQEVTQLLRAWGSGDEQALEKLMPLVYRQLRQVAHRYMAGERSGHVLQTSALGWLVLPDFAGVLAHHRVALLAAEGARKGFHVRKRTIAAEAR